MPLPTPGRKFAAMFTALAGFLMTSYFISEYGFTNENKTFNLSISDIGNRMLSYTNDGYALPFEVVSILLLAALVGAIVIAMKVKNTEQ